MSRTKIEWADAVWNPVTGCTPVSEGCQNCYARRFAQRLRGRCGYPSDNPFRVTLHGARWNEPFRWRKPRRVFVCSMSDLFHEDVPDEFIDDVMSTISACLQHTFLLLTKRPNRMANYFEAWMFWKQREIPRNLWLGVSAENQARADERIPVLLQVPAVVRFVSCEPLLGPVDLRHIQTDVVEIDALTGDHGVHRPLAGKSSNKLDWVVCGGETGPRARPCHPDWVRQIRDACVAAGVPFFFKSWGEYVTAYDAGFRAEDTDAWGQTFGRAWARSKPEWRFPDGVQMVHVGHRAAGRLLDGREWNEMPARVSDYHA